MKTKIINYYNEYIGLIAIVCISFSVINIRSTIFLDDLFSNDWYINSKSKFSEKNIHSVSIIHTKILIGFGCIFQNYEINLVNQPDEIFFHTEYSNLGHQKFFHLCNTG